MVEPKLSVFFRLVLLALVFAWSAFPIALIVASSFKAPADIIAFPPTILFVPTMRNYIQLWNLRPEFFSAMRNSLIIAAGATLLTVVISSLAGYVYSRYRGRLLASSAFLLILVRMIPPIVITLPLFPVVNLLRLNDTHILLIVLYSAFYLSLSTWIMKAFIDQIPEELDQAAYVDGASFLQLFRLIILPLAVPGMIAAATFSIIHAWNEFLFAFIFTSTRAKTTPLILSEMLSSLEGIEWGILFAATTVQLLPILLFVIVVQKYVVAGMTAGSVKG